jgi:hypothetical protein
MSSNLVNLDELVPGIQGTTFKYKDVDYTLRGDLPSSTVFEFLALYDELTKFQGEAHTAGAASDAAQQAALKSGDENAQRAAAAAAAEAILEIRDKLEKVTGQIRERLLTVFRLEHPDLEELPFGNQTTIIVLGEVLRTMGIGSSPVEPAPVPTPAPRKPRARKATAKKTTTSRSRTATARRTPRTK